MDITGHVSTGFDFNSSPDAARDIKLLDKQFSLIKHGFFLGFSTASLSTLFSLWRNDISRTDPSGYWNHEW